MAATAKQVDPMANRTAIHHPSARGAHQVDSEVVWARLRSRLESHRAIVPSANRTVRSVTNGPKPRESISSQSSWSADLGEVIAHMMADRTTRMPDRPPNMAKT